MNENIIKLSFASMIMFLLILSTVSAVNVNIISGTNTIGSVSIKPSDVINWHVMEIHDPSDITWSHVKISLFAISADSSRPIEKMYLYQCKAYNPLDCITKPNIPEPLEFTSYIDTELSWNDISERSGTAVFPQKANLIIFAKLKAPRDDWVAALITIERVRHDEFNIYNYDLDELDYYIKDPHLLNPVKTYIENYQMLPMEWSTGITLKNVNDVYALATGAASMGSVPINFRPEIPGSNIDSIVNDFYFVFPTDSNGLLNPITLNKNPGFTCGDGVCDTDLGESAETCCLDCGCQEGYYCDVASLNSPETGLCKYANNISLEVSGLFTKKITACQDTSKINFNAIIRNAPSGLQTPISGTIEIEDFTLPVECNGAPNALQCQTEFSTNFICGKFKRPLEYTLILPIEYNDGSNSVTKDLSFSNVGSPIQLEYDCKCDTGYFCDVANQACQPEDSIMLVVLDSTQAIYEYNPTGNNTVHITAQIENAPPNTTLLSATYKLKEIDTENNVLPGASGQLSCILNNDSEKNNVYDCQFGLSIPKYNHEKDYYVRNNEMNFKISYDDVGEHKTTKLSAVFSDISILPYTCGDGTCQSLENNKTCCLDCGCEGKNTYCDPANGCKSLDDLGLSVKASPTSFDDCLKEHVVKIKGQITGAGSTSTGGSSTGGGLTGYGIVLEPVNEKANSNLPTGTQLVTYEHLEDGVVSNYPISCGDINPVTGTFTCELSIGPFDKCAKPITIGPNELHIIISFANGNDIVSKNLVANFGTITVNPVTHPGDGVCETEQGESAATDCLDCPCEDDPKFGPDYYCNGKTCKPKSNVRLVIEEPKQDVYFKSCAIDNDLEIRAYVENEPSGMYLQYARAMLNGKAVDVNCYSASSSLGGGGGLQTISTMPTSGSTTAPGLTGYVIKPEPSTTTGLTSKADFLNAVRARGPIDYKKIPKCVGYPPSLSVLPRPEQGNNGYWCYLPAAKAIVHDAYSGSYTTNDYGEVVSSDKGLHSTILIFDPGHRICGDGVCTNPPNNKECIQFLANKYDSDVLPTSITNAALATIDGSGIPWGPKLKTGSATVSGTTAILNGELTDMGGKPSFNIMFGYGRGSCGENVVNVGPATKTGKFSVKINHLYPNTRYHYRIKASFGTGDWVYGEEKTFVTGTSGSGEVTYNNGGAGTTEAGGGSGSGTGYSGGSSSWAGRGGSCTTCGLSPGKEGRGSGEAGGLTTFHKNTYNCILTIPAEPECSGNESTNKSFTYRGNLQFFVTYKNGKNVEGGMLSANLPQIFTNKEPPAGYNYGGGAEPGTSEYAALEQKIKVMNEMKQKVQNCEPNLLDNILIAGKSGVVASADLISTAVCGIPGVNVVCVLGIPGVFTVKDVGTWAIRAGGSALINSQKNKCDNLKTQLKELQNDYNVELGQMSLQKCIASVVEAYKNGKCKSNLNIGAFAGAAPSIIERLLGLTGGATSNECGPCQMTNWGLAGGCRADTSLNGQQDGCDDGFYCYNGECVNNPCIPNPCGKTQKDCCGDGRTFECENKCAITGLSADSSYDCGTCDPCANVDCNSNSGDLTGTANLTKCETSEDCDWYDCYSCIDGSCQYKCSSDQKCNDGRCVSQGDMGVINNVIGNATIACLNDRECANVKGKPYCNIYTRTCVECWIPGANQCPDGTSCNIKTDTCQPISEQNGTVNCTELLQKCYDMYSSLEEHGNTMYKNEEDLTKGIINVAKNALEIADALGLQVPEGLKQLAQSVEVGGEINVSKLIETGIEWTPKIINWIGDLFTGNTSGAESDANQDNEIIFGPRNPEPTVI